MSALAPKRIFSGLCAISLTVWSGASALADQPRTALIAELRCDNSTVELGAPITMRFMVVNWSDTPTDPNIAESKLSVNGRELAQSAVLFGSTKPHTLKMSEVAEITKSVGSLFAKPGTYTVGWTGNQFRANNIRLVILPKSAAAPTPAATKTPPGMYGVPQTTPSYGSTAAAPMYGMPGGAGMYGMPGGAGMYGMPGGPGMYGVPGGGGMYGVPGGPGMYGVPATAAPYGWPGAMPGMYAGQAATSTRKFSGRGKDGITWVLDLGNPEPGSDTTTGWLYDERRSSVAHSIPANLKVVLKPDKPFAQVFFHDLGDPKRGKGEAKLLTKDGYLIWQLSAGKPAGQDRFPEEVQLQRTE